MRGRSGRHGRSPVGSVIRVVFVIRIPVVLLVRSPAPIPAASSRSDHFGSLISLLNLANSPASSLRRPIPHQLPLSSCTPMAHDAILLTSSASLALLSTCPRSSPICSSNTARADSDCSAEVTASFWMVARSALFQSAPPSHPVENSYDWLCSNLTSARCFPLYHHPISSARPTRCTVQGRPTASSRSLRPLSSPLLHSSLTPLTSRPQTSLRLRTLSLKLPASLSARAWDV